MSATLKRPFTLVAFVRESNRIEGIIGASRTAIEAHEELLTHATLTVRHVENLVAVLAGVLMRDRVGDDVYVGRYTPPRGGPHIREQLTALLRNDANLSPYEQHHAYEMLHPFMDGNGRSGRAVWLHAMGGIEHTPLGFLHHWYYQSLDARALFSGQRSHFVEID